METSRSILNQLLCLGMSLVLSLTLVTPALPGGVSHPLPDPRHPFTVNLQRMFLTKGTLGRQERINSKENA